MPKENDEVELESEEEKIERINKASIEEIENTKHMKCFSTSINYIYDSGDLNTIEDFRRMMETFSIRWLADFDGSEDGPYGSEEEMIKRLNECNINPEIEKYRDKGFRFIITMKAIEKEKEE